VVEPHENREAQTDGVEKTKEKQKIKRKKVGLTFGGGNGGPPRMEGGRGNLEEYGKWRSI
jgi:hypothetical protein